MFDEYPMFKIAYKVNRPDREIYKGFGFQHLSDATQYYVHPNNQSKKATTTLCQPIGEAIILFAQMLKEMENNPIGDFYMESDKKSDTYYLCIDVPEEYRTRGVVDPDVYQYRVMLTANYLSAYISGYTEEGVAIRGEDGYERDMRGMMHKLIPFFLGFLAKEVAENLDFRMRMAEFVSNPRADSFVNLHEDFYQNHKSESYMIFVHPVEIPPCTSLSHLITNSLLKNNKEEPIHMEKIMFDSNTFSKEQISLIPELSAEFALPEGLESICNAIASGDCLSLLLHGPAGTGKTISCKLIARETGLPLMETINCTENLDEFVLGKYIPEDDRIVFKESYVTKAIRDGGAVVFEEINFAKPQYLAFLNSLLDDNGFVRLDNGEVIRRHKNFRFFATMNMGYFGTKELNQALYNRFNSIVEISALSDEAIIGMLVARVPECKKKVKKLVGVYHKIQKKIEAEELDMVISPRNLENWARMAKYDGYVRAAEKTIIPIAKCDRALEVAFRGIISLYKWNDKVDTSMESENSDSTKEESEKITKKRVSGKK